MRNEANHISEKFGIPGETEKIIAGSRINWNKTREEIWPELMEKIEGEATISLKPSQTNIQLRWLAVAASVLIVLSIPAVMFLYTKTIHTHEARQVEILLPDHSHVTVNEQSEISYKPLLWKFARKIRLEGEAMFEVQKGKTFEVISHKGKTKVLGTQFDVYSRNENYNVTCISGKVKVEEYAYQNYVVITKGQKAILKPDGTFEIEEKQQPQIENLNNNNQTDKVTIELDEVLSPATSTQKPATDTEKPGNSETTETNTVKPNKEKEEKPAGGFEQNEIKTQAKTQSQPTEAIQTNEKTGAQAETKNQEQQQSQSQENNANNNSGNQNRDRFRASLTPEQISILENTKMNREEKRRAFMESLSSEQKELLKEQNAKRVQEQTSSKAQTGKGNIQEQTRETTGKETHEQQMQQAQDNKGNTNAGNDNQQGSGNNTGQGKGPGNQPGKGN